MKALVLKETNQPLQFEECPNPEAGTGSALVTLKAAALNRRDYWITQGMYPGVQTPCILGSDGAGVVSTTGEEVIICPSIDWGNDPAAQQESFRILGMPDNGTFAEQIAVETQLLAAKPDHLSWAEAAALPLAGLTAYRALFSQGGLQRDSSSDQTVLITGIGGGVATFALQFAVAAGAKVLVTSSSAEKIERAVSLGATAGADYKQDGWARDLGKAHGPIDLVIDSAGGEGYNDLLDLVKAGGRIVNYGATAGPPRKLDMFKLFWKQLHLVGCTMGSPDDFTAMVKFVNERKIRPIVDQTVPLAEGSDLIASMAASPQFGKLVLEIPG
jgi:zinc-binding alcohol dehydrogenase/oxidoreductase